MATTIVRDSNFVSIDGVGLTVDCSSLPADVHAIQWGGDHGEVEYSPSRCAHCGVRSKKGNEWITDFTPYAGLVDAWRAAKEKHDAEVVERKRQEQVVRDQLEAERIRREKQRAEADTQAKAAQEQNDAAKEQAGVAGPQS